jgi:Tetratricopeptide repeat/FecR protein
VAGERVTPPAPPPPPSPLWRADGLWRRLAQAQDDALAREVPPAPRVPARRRLRARPLIGSLVVLGAVAAAVALWVHRAPLQGRQIRIVQGGQSGEMERVLVADARSDLPLVFSDGSNLTFRAGSSGRMQRLGGDGAQVFLDGGRLEAHVIHAERTLWLVHAGPYRVRVTGTRFAVNWAAGRLDVALFEGSVMIDGAVLGAGLPLRAGQQLTVDRGVVRTQALAHVGAAASQPVGPTTASLAAPATGSMSDLPASGEGPPAGPVPVEAPAPAPAATSMTAPGGGPATSDVGPLRNRASDGDWFTLAKQSAYVEAFAAARRVGWAKLCRHLDAHRLLALGDVARYAGARARARQAFEALATRFPRSPLAADAVFSLGRMAFESDQSDRAAHWFRRYVDDWPHGPLADQAVGRLVECALHMHDTEAARGAARAYLSRAPSGPHARLARQILRDGVGPTASANP